MLYGVRWVELVQSYLLGARYIFPEVLWRCLQGWLSIPATCLAIEAFLFGFDGLNSCIVHMYKSKINKFWVSLLSYCITFLPEPDKHQQSPGTYDPGEWQAQATRSCFQQKEAAHPLAREASIRILSERRTAVNAF